MGFKPNPCYALSISPSIIFVAKSLKQALIIPEWNSAMLEEFEALKKNGTWELYPLSLDDNVINSLWVFKIKQHEEGFVESFKACLVSNDMS